MTCPRKSPIRGHRSSLVRVRPYYVAQPDAAGTLGTETNNYGQGAIDLAKLAKREQPVGFAEAARIDGTQLLDQDPRPLTVDFNFWPERRRMGARGGWRDDHGGQAQKFVSLNDYSIALPGLLVSSGPSWGAESKDLTALHEVTPSTALRGPSPYGLRDQRSVVWPRQRGRRACRAGRARLWLPARPQTGCGPTRLGIAALPEPLRRDESKLPSPPRDRITIV